MRWRHLRSALLVLAVVVLLALVPLLNRIAPDAVSGLLGDALLGVAALGRFGAVPFILLQVGIAVSGLVPASLLGMAAGAVYGVAAGFGIAAAGTMAGAWIAFWLSRSLWRRWVERMLADRPRLRDLDARLGRENWKLVCLLRASPVMPFAVTSYTLGLSSVTPGAYMLGTLAAMPALLGYVVLGSLAKAGLAAGQSGSGSYRWMLLGVGAIATLVLTARMGRVVAAVLSASDAPKSVEA